MLNEHVKRIFEGHPPKVRNSGENNKWQPIYEQLQQMPIVKKPDENNGWKGFGVANKKVAGAAATSVSSHCYRILKSKEDNWRIQTTIQETPEGTILWLRKISIK